MQMTYNCNMKISISILSDGGEVKPVVCEQDYFQHEAGLNDRQILESAEDFALRNVVLGYFDAAFGMSSQDAIFGAHTEMFRAQYSLPV